MKKDKEITIYDIAKALNISASTVSRALNGHPSIHEKTKEKINAKAKELGYQQNTFASNLRRKSSNTIGVIVPRLDSYFMATVINGIEKELNKAGYNLIISQSQESIEKETKCVTTLFGSRVGGVIMSLSSQTENLEHLNLFLDKEIPVVLFDRTIDHPDCTSVFIDNFKAGYEVTNHLINEGCRNIFHFTGNINCSVYKERFLGYKKALEENNINFDENLLIAEDLSESAREGLIRKITSKSISPDAIFATNDNSAVEIICSLEKAGYKIPKDIAVAGFNNNPISNVVSPNLTSVDYTGEEMGEISAITILNKIKNSSYKSDKILLGHRLIVRPSSKRKL